MLSCVYRNVDFARVLTLTIDVKNFGVQLSGMDVTPVNGAVFWFFSPREMIQTNTWTRESVPSVVKMKTLASSTFVYAQLGIVDHRWWTFPSLKLNDEFATSLEVSLVAIKLLIKLASL